MSSTNIPETKIHSYNVSVAADTKNINAAVIFQNICFWVEQNYANERNFINGKYWTYNTVKAFRTMFPEMTANQISYALQKLEEKGYIESAFLCEDTRDRTKWYTVCDFDRWIHIQKSNSENSDMAMENSNMAKENSEMFNNNINNIDYDTDNNRSNKNQADNKPTDNYHMAETLSNDNAEADTISLKKSLPSSDKKKTKSELMELEVDMCRRFANIGSQYDVSNTALKNIVNAFARYSSKYTEITGKIHPILRDETLEKIFVTLATISDTEYEHFENVADYEPDSNGVSYLDEMVDEHFNSNHAGSTDLHISHFAKQDYLEKMAQHVVEW